MSINSLTQKITTGGSIQIPVKANSAVYEAHNKVEALWDDTLPSFTLAESTMQTFLDNKTTSNHQNFKKAIERAEKSWKRFEKSTLDFVRICNEKEPFLRKLYRPSCQIWKMLVETRQKELDQLNKVANEPAPKKSEDIPKKSGWEAILKVAVVTTAILTVGYLAAPYFAER